MKKITILLFLLAALNVTAQEEKQTYYSFSAEMIFSWAAIDNQGNSDGNIMRWAPVFNLQSMINHDLSDKFGLFAGTAIRNVGFIYKDPYDVNNTKFKYRTYNFGIPVGFKIGQMDNALFFAGYEIEFPITYKEKQFVNESKVKKDHYWFSDKVEKVQHSLMAGIQLPYGATLKFKYYLTNFHNRDYPVLVDDVETKPYDFKSNVFYFSLAVNVFRNWEDAYTTK